jgi:hypothetical protein
LSKRRKNLQWIPPAIERRYQLKEEDNDRAISLLPDGSDKKSMKEPSQEEM